MASKGPWRSTRPKVPTVAMYTNPGPKYGIPSGFAAKSTNVDKNDTLYESPAYSIASAWPKSLPQTPGPGPAGYKPDPKFTKDGRDGGPYAFSTWKPKDPLERRGPGPTDYDTTTKNNVWSKLKNAPAASMGSRNKGPAMSRTPGPSAYTVGKQQIDLLNHRAPSFVMGEKRKETTDLKFPGPGAYQDAPIYRYKKGTPPAYSMAKKWPDFPSHNLTPSPMVYDVQPGVVGTKKKRPAFTFGNHHSDYASWVQTRADVDGDCLVCDKDDYCKETAPPPPDDCPPVVSC